MIPLDKLRAITHVVTHANCPDGVASALIVKDALPNVRVSFMAYESAEHRALEPEPGVLFVDFSPYLGKVVHEEGSTLWHWQQAGAIVLDHHPTCRDVVEAFGELGVFGLNERGECGAWLAYEHVWKPLREAEAKARAWNSHYPDTTLGNLCRFAELAAVRDTWKNKDPRWDKALRLSELLLFWRMSQPVDYYFEDVRVLGQHLLDKKLEAAHTSLDEGAPFTTSKGTRGIMFQGVATTSDAAEIDEKGGELFATLPDGSVASVGRANMSPHDLVVGFHYKVDAGKLTLQFSMRSHTGRDVGAFAKHHGGGGHKAAAGFTVEVSPELSANPYQVFRLLLEQWEGRADLLSDEEMFGR